MEKHVFIFKWILIFTLCFSISSCGSGSSDEQNIAEVTSIESSNTSDDPIIDNSQSTVTASFFPTPQAQGQTSFTLQPIESLKADEEVTVSFGVPFPKGFIFDLNNFRVVNSEGNEVPIHAKKTLMWRQDSSYRSISVQMNTVFANNEHGILSPNHYTLEWGVKRELSELQYIPIRNLWALVDDEEYEADFAIFEPKAYAVFTAQWYGKSVIKSRLLPFHSHKDFSANDIAFQLFGDTAIQLVPFKTSYSAWLFDRAMTLYQLAFRSGEYNYLRAAHKASQFYLQHINDDGYFGLKPSNDMKYSYGESLVANYILVGDERIPETLERMLSGWETFKTEYTLASNFWTERHAGYQLLGYLSAYEVLGTETLKAKVKNTFSILRRMQVNPNEGIPITGALMHTGEAHGETGEQFIASPWMSTILLSAVERYYLNFADEDAVDFTLKMADFFIQEDVSMYQWAGYKGIENYTVPYYLASADSSFEARGEAGLPDLEHAHDVTKIFALAYYFSCHTVCDTKYLHTLSKLNNSAITFGFPHWIRTSAPELGFSSFRLAPPRKFSWWFQHTANNDFLLGSETQLPFYHETAPQLVVEQSHNITSTVKPGDEITFTYRVVNKGSKAVKNIVLMTKSLQSSPNNLLDIVSSDTRAINRGDAVVWKFDSIEANSVIDELSYTVKVNMLPALPSLKRPLGDIVAYVDVNYCEEEDTITNCIPWSSTSAYDLGQQTVHTQSNWQRIELVQPITPPLVTVSNLIDNDVLSGVNIVEAEVIDPDDIANVEFYLDNKLVKHFVKPPYQYVLQTDALSDDAHLFSVKAVDVFGSESLLDVSFSAKTPDVLAPTVDILTPQHNSEFCGDTVVAYRAQDEFFVESCQLTLNQNDSIATSCDDYKIPNILPLFSASATLTFTSDTERIKSTDEQTLIGHGVNVTSTAGYVNQGVLFSSSKEGFVEFTQTHLNIKNDITVSFWMNPKSDESVLLSQDWYYIGIEKGWAISLGANKHKDNNALSLTWSSGNNRENLNERNVVQTPSNTVELNVWQHVVVRKTDTLVDIFIDGELITSQHIASADIAWPHDSQQTFYLGKAMQHPDNYNQYYNGVLDEVSIWDESLSNADINQLYERIPSLGTQKLTITAIDKAGNKGQSSVDFKFIQCN